MISIVLLLGFFILIPLSPVLVPLGFLAILLSPVIAILAVILLLLLPLVPPLILAALVTVVGLSLTSWMSVLSTFMIPVYGSVLFYALVTPILLVYGPMYFASEMVYSIF